MTSTPFSDAAAVYHRVEDVVDVVGNPLGEAVDTGLDWLLHPFVAPLLELLEIVVGDPDQLDRHAAAWQRAAAQLETVARQQEQQLATLLDGWEGEASRAYAAKITVLVAALRESGRQMTGTADSLGDTATDLRTAEELIRTIIRELVEWLVITWLAAQALAWATAGASELVAAEGSIVEAGIAALRAKRVVDTLRIALYAYTEALEAMKAAGLLGRAAAFVLDPKRLAIKPVITLTGLDGDLVGETVEGLLDGLVDAAADEADDHRNGTDGSANGTDSAFREWVSGVADPVADRTAPVVDPLVDSLDGGTP